MGLDIERADFAKPELRVFLQEHLDELAPTAPLESRHALDVTAVDQPKVRLWVAFDERNVVATGALAEIELPALGQQPDAVVLLDEPREIRPRRCVQCLHTEPTHRRCRLRGIPSEPAR